MFNNYRTWLVLGVSSRVFFACKRRPQNSQLTCYFSHLIFQKHYRSIAFRCSPLPPFFLPPPFFLGPILALRKVSLTKARALTQTLDNIQHYVSRLVNTKHAYSFQHTTLLNIYIYIAHTSLSTVYCAVRVVKILTMQVVTPCGE